MAAPQLPAAGSFLPGAGSNAAVTPQLEALLAVTKQLPGGAVSGTLTLDGNSGGRAVPTGALHRVDTFGQAASGTLGKLGTTNLDVGRRVRLGCASSLRPVTLLHAAGTAEQLFLANGVSMALASDTASIDLERQADGWHEVERWWGTQDGAFRSWLSLGSAATTDLASQSEAEAGSVDTRTMTPLKVRQAQIAKGWAAALPVYGGTFDPTKWLLYYDAGTPGFYRVPGSAVVGQAPSKFFDSGPLPIISAGFQELPHGLGGIPRLTKAWLVNVTPELGYLTGYQVDTPGLRTYAGLSTTATPSVQIVAWEANMGASAPALFVNGGAAQITNASWRIRLVCWL